MTPPHFSAAVYSGPRYPVAMHSAHAGEKLPIAKIPAGVKFKSGDESVYAGKAL